MHREVILKVRRAIFFLHGFTMHALASHSSFLTWTKVVFGAVVGWLTCWVRSYGSCDMEHAAPGERAPCLKITQRQLRARRLAGRRLK